MAIRVPYLDDDGASAAPFYGNSITPAFICPDGRNVHRTVQTYLNDAGTIRKLNVHCIYDTETGTDWRGGVIMEDISDNVGPADNHGVSSLVFDDFGHLHAFGGCHSDNPLKHSVLVDGEGTNWRADATLGTGQTYSHPINIDGKLYVFSRADAANDMPMRAWRSTSINATTGEVTWQSFGTFASFGSNSRTYMGRPSQRGTEIFIPLVYATFSDSIRQDVFILVLDTASDTIRNLSGSTTVTTGQFPVTLAQAQANFRVINQTDNGEQGNLPATCFDANGDLVIAHQGGADATSCRVMIVDPDTGATVEAATEVGTMVRRYGASAVGLDPQGAIEVMFEGSGEQASYETNATFTVGGDIYYTKRTGAATYSAPERVAKATPIYPLSHCHSVDNGPPSFRFAFAERADTEGDWYTHGCCRTFGWGEGGLVTKPAQIDSDVTAWATRAGVTLDDDEAASVSQLARMLKRTRYWGLLDSFHVFSAGSKALAMQNLLAATALTEIEPTQHNPGEGVFGGWLGTGMIAGTGTKLQRDSITMGVVCHTDDIQNSGAEIGTRNGAIDLIFQANSGFRLARNQWTNDPVGSTNLLRLAHRPASNAERVRDKFAANVSAYSNASTGLTAEEITYMGRQANRTPRRVALGFFGADNDFPNTGPLFKGVQRYMADIGMIPGDMTYSAQLQEAPVSGEADIVGTNSLVSVATDAGAVSYSISMDGTDSLISVDLNPGRVFDGSIVINTPKVRTATAVPKKPGASAKAVVRISFPEKEPAEILDYAIDWSQRLLDDEIVSQELILDSGDVTVFDVGFSGAFQTFWLSGGSLNTNKITARITTAVGRVMEEDFYIYVGE